MDLNNYKKRLVELEDKLIKELDSIESENTQLYDLISNEHFLNYHQLFVNIISEYKNKPTITNQLLSELLDLLQFQYTFLSNQDQTETKGYKLRQFLAEHIIWESSFIYYELCFHLYLQQGQIENKDKMNQFIVKIENRVKRIITNLLLNQLSPKESHSILVQHLHKITSYLNQITKTEYGQIYEESNSNETIDYVKIVTWCDFLLIELKSVLLKIVLKTTKANVVPLYLGPVFSDVLQIINLFKQISEQEEDMTITSARVESIIISSLEIAKLIKDEHLFHHLKVMDKDSLIMVLLPSLKFTLSINGIFNIYSLHSNYNEDNLISVNYFYNKHPKYNIIQNNNNISNNDTSNELEQKRRFYINIQKLSFDTSTILLASITNNTQPYLVDFKLMDEPLVLLGYLYYIVTTIKINSIMTIKEILNINSLIATLSSINSAPIVYLDYISYILLNCFETSIINLSGNIEQVIKTWTDDVINCPNPKLRFVMYKILQNLLFNLNDSNKFNVILNLVIFYLKPNLISNALEMLVDLLQISVVEDASTNKTTNFVKVNLWAAYLPLLFDFRQLLPPILTHGSVTNDELVLSVEYIKQNNKLLIKLLNFIKVTLMLKEKKKLDYSFKYTINELEVNFVGPLKQYLAIIMDNIKEDDELIISYLNDTLNNTFEFIKLIK
ncbi:hypothetical protein K502DRAFT_346700 [Neoconidiobolus thromboides FSU 785]|nr:hypothetical protein K502DRAFT_346700 [Neoconidiobolus thromboides FSU 785]